MAGIIDLRGKIVEKANKLRKTQQITLYVESAQLPVIKRLALMTGSNPEPKSAGSSADGWWRRNCEEHCPDQHVHVIRSEFPDTLRWTVTGAALGIVLHNLTPFLVQDKGFTRAKDMALRDMTLRGRGAKAVVDSLRRLESLGWDFPEHVVIPNSLSTFDVIDAEVVEETNGNEVRDPGLQGEDG
jgi:hypothetical protein